MGRWGDGLPFRLSPFAFRLSGDEAIAGTELAQFQGKVGECRIGTGA